MLGELFRVRLPEQLASEIDRQAELLHVSRNDVLRVALGRGLFQLQAEPLHEEPRAVITDRAQEVSYAR